jgi:hypothetical protein
MTKKGHPEKEDSLNRTEPTRYTEIGPEAVRQAWNREGELAPMWKRLGNEPWSRIGQNSKTNSVQHICNR